MPTLEFTGNVAPGVKAIKLRYRPAGSTGAYNEISLPVGTTLPYAGPEVQSGLYEVGIQTQCANDIWSAWVYGTSTPCKLPISFQVSRIGSNFVVVYGVGADQAGIQVDVTDPNNGVANYVNAVGGNATFNIPITSDPSGTWIFKAKAICDADVSPVYASLYRDPVTVNIETVCNPPTITAISDISLDTNTITKQIAFSGYTTQVRIRIYDQLTNAEYFNNIVTTPGYIQQVLLKGKNYVVEVYNQCPGGQESVASAEFSTLWKLVNVKASNASGTVCAATATDRYIAYNAVAIATGVKVYTDKALSVPLLSFTYIVETNGGNIYQLDPGSGIVSTNTSTFC